MLRVGGAAAGAVAEPVTVDLPCVELPSAESATCWWSAWSCRWEAARAAAAWLAPVPWRVEGLSDLIVASWVAVTATSDSFHMSRLGLRVCLLASWRWLGVDFGGGSGGS